MRRAILILTLMGAMIFAGAGVVFAQTTAPSSGGQPSPLPANAERVCAVPSQPDKAACHALRRTDIGSGAHPKATTSYSNGYQPSDLVSAYNLSRSGTYTDGSAGTVAIVDAYDNPNAESDLSTYRSQFGLGDCTTANGCFKKVNQNGVQGSYPNGDTGWGQEIALDLDMASAICPNCKILLVEAN